MGTTATCSDSVGTTLFGSVRGRVLGLLYRSPKRDWYMREIVRALDAGHGAVQRELKRLEACGLVTATRRGRQVFYQANQDAPVFPELRALLVKTTGIADVLREALAPDADQIDVAFIFGSIAAGTDREDSEIDVMIIGSLDWLHRRSSTLDASLELGRDVNPVIWSPADLAERLATQNHFACNVMRGPKIFLMGDEHELRRLAQGGPDQAPVGNSTRRPSAAVQSPAAAG